MTPFIECEHGPAIGASEPGQPLIPEDATVEKLHQVEAAANDRIVFAQRVDAWNRHCRTLPARA